MKTCHLVKFDGICRIPQDWFQTTGPAQCRAPNNKNKGAYAAAGVAAGRWHPAARVQRAAITFFGDGDWLWPMLAFRDWFGDARCCSDEFVRVDSEKRSTPALLRIARSVLTGKPGRRSTKGGFGLRDRQTVLLFKE